MREQRSWASAEQPVNQAARFAIDIIDPRHRRAVEEAAPVGLGGNGLLGHKAAEQRLDGREAPPARLANPIADLCGGERAVFPQRFHHSVFCFADALRFAIFAFGQGTLPRLLTTPVLIATTFVNMKPG